MQYAEQLQETKPLFVRSRYREIIWKDKSWTFQEYVPWQELGIPIEIVKAWWSADLVMHSEELEKAQKVGDRLEELNATQLRRLRELMNSVIKKRTTSEKDFGYRRVKGSANEEKQRSLIRQWLRRNEWANDMFEEYRDHILNSASKPVEEKVED